MPAAFLPASTLEGLEGVRSDRRAEWSRRAFLALLVLVLVAGVSGRLGVRTERREASEGSWTVGLTYAAVARAGLDVPFEVTVHREGGFDGPVTLALTGDYLDIFETQGFTPEPSATTRGVDRVYLEFDPPSGSTLVVAYDAYIQPSSQVGADGTVGVYDGGRVQAAVSFRTLLLP